MIKIILVLILVFLGGAFFLKEKTAVAGTETIWFEQSMVYLTNAERGRKLVQDDCLNEMAVVRARYLVENNIWAHYSSDGTTPWNFLEECGDYVYLGENLMKNFSDPALAHQALMKSSTHKKNIVNPQYGRIGVGCYENICVEFFKD